MHHTFDVKCSWRPRFSIEELKRIYIETLGYDSVVENTRPSWGLWKYWDVFKDSTYGKAKLKTGEIVTLRCCTQEELDYFLYFNDFFGIDAAYAAFKPNPYTHMLSREEVKIAFDLQHAT